MQNNFKRALAIELTFEGGKDDDPVDPGGRTNQGIIQRVYASYRVRKGLPARDVFLMQDNERDEIYDTQYFRKVRFDELPPGVDIMMVDGAINSGPGQSIKWIQRALGLTADGVLGEVTMQRILDHENHDALIKATLDRRRAFLRGLSTFGHFGKGWLSRVDQLQKTGQLWAMGNVGPVVTFVPNGNKKADIIDAKPLPSMSYPAALSGGGTISTALTTVQQTLEPLAQSELVQHILIGVLAASAVATAVGFAWSYWAKTKRDSLVDVLDLVQHPAINDNAEVPQEVLRDYADPEARGSETGNVAPGAVTTSGRTAGDTEVRVNPPTPVPSDKAA